MIRRAKAAGVVLFCFADGKHTARDLLQLLPHPVHRAPHQMRLVRVHVQAALSCAVRGQRHLEHAHPELELSQRVRLVVPFREQPQLGLRQAATGRGAEKSKTRTPTTSQPHRSKNKNTKT